MPFFLLGARYALDFWASNWPLGTIMLSVLILIDAFFIANWRLFALLEREDWPALAHYLEARLDRKKSLSPRMARLLVNSYLALAEHQSAIALQKKFSDKPKMLDALALPFGLAWLLAGDPEKAKAFLGERRKSDSVKEKDWVEFYYAFSLLLSRSFTEAADSLINCAGAKDPLVAGLGVHFIESALAPNLAERREEALVASRRARESVIKILPTRASWDKETARAAHEVHVVVMRKTLAEAADRLFSKELSEEKLGIQAGVKGDRYENL